MSHQKPDHPILVACPFCSKSYEVPASAAGKRGKCIQCGAVVEIPKETQHGASPTDEIVAGGHETSPGHVDEAVLLGAASAKERSDKGESVAHACPTMPDTWVNDCFRASTQETAQRELDRLRREMPPVQNTRRRKNTYPPKAGVYLTAGALAAVPVVATIGLVGSVLQILLFFAWRVGLGFFPREEAFGFTHMAMMAVGGTVYFSAFLFTYYLIGRVAARMVSWAGKQATNRSAGLAWTLAAVSCLLGIIVMWHFLLLLWHRTLSAEDLQFTASVAWIPGLVWIPVLVGTVVAAISAGISLWVKKETLCDTCDSVMKAHGFPAVGASTAISMVRALSEGKIALAADVMSAGKTGVRSAPRLLVCPKCGSGHLELRYRFLSRVKKPPSTYTLPSGRVIGSEKDLTQTPFTLESSWLAISKALSPDEVELWLPKSLSGREPT